MPLARTIQPDIEPRLADKEANRTIETDLVMTRSNDSTALQPDEALDASNKNGNTPANQGNEGLPPLDAKNNQYAVERLLNDRAIARGIRGRNQRVIQYCVRWERYGPIHD
jgi:hypothetical protein